MYCLSNLSWGDNTFPALAILHVYSAGTAQNGEGNVLYILIHADTIPVQLLWSLDTKCANVCNCFVFSYLLGVGIFTSIWGLFDLWPTMCQEVKLKMFWLFITTHHLRWVQRTESLHNLEDISEHVIAHTHSCNSAFSLPQQSELLVTVDLLKRIEVLP